MGDDNLLGEIISDTALPTSTMLILPTAGDNRSVEEEPVVATKAEVPTPPSPKRPFAIVKKVQKNSYLKMMIYGAPGAGKTRLAAQMHEIAEMRSVLYISAEGGEASIPYDDIPLLRLNTWDPIAKITKFLETQCRLAAKNDRAQLVTLHKLVSDDDHTEETVPIYNTVIIDSISEVAKYAMNRSLGVEMDSIDLNVTSEKPEFKNWGEVNDMLGNFIRILRDLPLNVILTCAEDSVKEEATGRISRFPAISGKARNAIIGYMDTVAYLATTTNAEGKTIRRAFLQPGANNSFVAKNRLLGLTDKTYIDQPHIAHFVKALRK